MSAKIRKKKQNSPEVNTTIEGYRQTALKRRNLKLHLKLYQTNIEIPKLPYSSFSKSHFFSNKYQSS